MIPQPQTGLVNMNGPFGPTYQKSPHPNGIITSSKFDSLPDLAQKICSRERDGTDFWTQSNQKLTSYLLTPDEIQQFLTLSTAYENLPYYGENMGNIISSLINNAYNHGDRKFCFDLTALKPIMNFASLIKKDGNADLEIIVHGEVGSLSFLKSKGSFYCERLGLVTVNISGTLAVHQTTDAYNLSFPKEQYCSVVRMANEKQGLTFYSLPFGDKMISQTNNIAEGRSLVTKDDSVVAWVNNERRMIQKIQKIPTVDFESRWQQSIPYFERLNKLFGGHQ